jgi:hypothetical protein
MATIITVHGTHASGPEEGDRWWQRGSDFERALKRWVTATTGELTIRPLIWDGHNSEASRFHAGSRLAADVQSLEKDGEPYCLVGHSHGGSVVGHALVKASLAAGPLRSLRRWITVGTPFIDTRLPFLLFSRLEVPGVAAYLIFAYLVLVWAAFGLSSISLLLTSKLRNPPFDILVLVAGGGFLGFVYRRLYRLQPEKVRQRDHVALGGVADRLGRTWLALWHRGDEAIQGLKLLKELRIEPFDRNFASPVLAFASLLLLPVLMFWMSRLDQYEPLADIIRFWRPTFIPALDCESQSGLVPVDNECADVFKQFARNNLAIIAYPARLLHDALAWSGLAARGSTNFNRTVLTILLVVGVLLGFATFWFLGMVIHRAVLVTARSISSVVSRMLNRFTRMQAVRVGYGCDTIGERPAAVMEHPGWLPAPFPPLPAALETEITRASNDAAAASIGKLRSALGVIAFSEVDYNPADLVSQCLSGRELVHTNYFHSERVHKLIAYAITREDGFQPTGAFLHDPDYADAARWYDELLGNSTATVEG